MGTAASRDDVGARHRTGPPDFTLLASTRTRAASALHWSAAVDDADRARMFGTRTRDAAIFRKSPPLGARAVSLRTRFRVVDLAQCARLGKG
jgi:hypothetical protein